MPRRARRTHSGAEARAAVRAALRLPVEESAEQYRPSRGSEPVVLASGNLGLVSFPDVPHRMTKEEIDARHPALLPTLANHPGIGFLLVRSERHGGVVLGAYGAEIPLDELDDNPGPLAPFGPGAADVVRRTHTFPHTADIMVNSFHDPADGEVLAFEEQIGSHGGLGAPSPAPSCCPRWCSPRRSPRAPSWPPAPNGSTTCSAAGSPRPTRPTPAPSRTTANARPERGSTPPRRGNKGVAGGNPRDGRARC